MKIKWITLFLLLYSLITVYCWKNQTHDILAPKTPIYQVTGSVTSSLDHQPIADVIVSISGTVTYTGEDSSTAYTQVDTTDINGFYEFLDVPGGYGYNIMLNKEGYEPYLSQIVLYYGDKKIQNISLGKYLIEVERVFFPNLQITGIAVVDTTIYMTTHQKEFVAYNLESQKETSIPFEDVEPTVLAWDGNSFWSTDNIRKILFQFKVQEPDKQIEFNTTYPLPPNNYQPEDTLAMLDMVCFEKGIVGCSSDIGHRYIQWIPWESNHLSYLNSPENLYTPIGIAVYNDTILMACYYQSNRRMYQINSITNEILSYSVFPEEIGMITGHNKTIWMARDHTIIKYIF